MQKLSWSTIIIGFIDYAKAFDCVDHNKLWNILKEMGILDHLTCLLRNNIFLGLRYGVILSADQKKWVS